MNWDKKIYPKDVWNWIKEKLSVIGIGHAMLWRKPKRLKRPAPWPPPQGGFTPRREVSRISPARFDDLLGSNRLDDETRWAMINYELAERTGLWSTNMVDEPTIDIDEMRKFIRERK